MNSKATRNAFFASVVSLIVCFTMLMGSTFAWFVDRVNSSGNRIEAGNLSVDLMMYNSSTENYVSIAGTDVNVFSLSEGNDTPWYPGVTKTIYFAVRNTGSLPVKYDADIKVTDGGLAEVLDYAVAENHGAGTITSLAAAQEADGPSGSLAVATIAVADGKILAAVDADSDDTEAVGETHYYALTVSMKSNAAETYAEKNVTINIVVNATQANMSENGTYSEVSALSEIPDEEKVTSLALTSWKFNETVNDLELFAEPEPETDATEYIFPAKSTISDGENEYELSGFELTERDGIKLLTAVKAEAEVISEDANAEATAETVETVDAPAAELAFVYYEKVTEADNESEGNEENVNGWYLLELESVKTALSDETASLADLVKEKETIEDAEKLPIVSFAESEADILENADLINWLYQNAVMQEIEN